MNTPLAPNSCAGNPLRLLTRIAKARGATTVEQVREFLARLPELRNPLEAFPDLARAIHARIDRAVRNQERILIWGDYDVDGLTSTVQLLRYLEARGATARSFIPDRANDGYGLTERAACRLIADFRPALLIAVDCGSSAAEALAIFSGSGCDAIVIDHHKVSGIELPNGVIQLNPHSLPGASEELTQLCAGALVHCLLRLFTSFGEATDSTWLRTESTVLAGLATLVDVMPLTGFNRTLVKHSLAAINQPSTRIHLPGLAALLPSSTYATSWTYAFQLGPILNAAGRISHAQLSLDLLLTKDAARAENLARDAIALNQARQREQQEILREARSMASQILEARPSTKVLVLAKAEWHPGIVGIVASKIREETHHPCFVFGQAPDANAGTHWQGSGRSVPKYGIGGAVRDAVARGLALSGGGHKAAAGVAVTADGLAAFTRFIEEGCDLRDADFTSAFETVPYSPRMTLHQWREFYEVLEPFGAGNPRPLVRIPKARILQRPRFIRASHPTNLQPLTGFFLVNVHDIDNRCQLQVRYDDKHCDLPDLHAPTPTEFAVVMRLQTPLKKSDDRTCFCWVLEDIERPDPP